MKNIFQQNKVLIVGLLSSVLLAVSELVKGGNASIKLLVFSGFIAGATFLARNLRGQWATISGILASALTAYLTQSESGHVSWAQIVTQMAIALLGILAAPAKSVGYERSAPIVEAKTEGEIIQPTVAAPNPPTKP